MPDTRVSILLADDDALRREGLAAVLKKDRAFRIVASVSDGEEALRRILELRPDVVVTDLHLPGLPAIELLRRVRRDAGTTKVVIVAGTDDEGVVREAVQAGASGYLLNSGPARHLTDAIRYVRDGGQYFSPQLKRDGRDRHYEILSKMADNIRPVLDRLDEIDSRVSQMEAGEEPVPARPREWLNGQQLPEMIERAVAERFRQMAGRLQDQIEETHVRTLENFVRNMQVKLVERVSALETDMSHQAQAMRQLQQYSQRTEDNLSRLISGVDKLAQELPRRLTAPSVDFEERPIEGGDAFKPEKRSRGGTGVKKIWAALLALLVLSFAGWGAKRMLVKTRLTGGGRQAAQTSPQTAPVAFGTDTRSRLAAARDYSDRKEFGAAEKLYREIAQSEPKNADALQGLASVLYREDKMEEAAAVLDRLPN